MRPEAYTPRVTGVMVLLCLALPVLAERADAQVLRYVARADPFEVQLTLPDGAKQTTPLRREATHFYFLAEQGWPVPEGANDKGVRCDIRWEGFPADWRLANSFGIDRRTQEFWSEPLNPPQPPVQLVPTGENAARHVQSIKIVVSPPLF